MYRLGNLRGFHSSGSDGDQSSGFYKLGGNKANMMSDRLQVEAVWKEKNNKNCMQKREYHSEEMKCCCGTWLIKIAIMLPSMMDDSQSLLLLLVFSVGVAMSGEECIYVRVVYRLANWQNGGR
eukprot:scaffold13023_cov89-Cyclotella_meneghiniana.AAC.4